MQQHELGRSETPNRIATARRVMYECDARWEEEVQGCVGSARVSRRAVDVLFDGCAHLHAPSQISVAFSSNATGDRPGFNNSTWPGDLWCGSWRDGSTQRCRDTLPTPFADSSLFTHEWSGKPLKCKKYLGKCCSCASRDQHCNRGAGARNRGPPLGCDRHGNLGPLHTPTWSSIAEELAAHDCRRARPSGWACTRSADTPRTTTPIP